MYATVGNSSGGSNLAYIGLDSLSPASSTSYYYLDTGSAIGTGYRTGPHLFYFSPQNRWYLIYKAGALPSFSTNTDPSNPGAWSAPQKLFSSTPSTVSQNWGQNGYWQHFWVICDDAYCYMFSHDGQGHLYRSRTTVADFPDGFGNTIVLMEDSNLDLFDGGNVYRVEGTGRYLLMVEAFATDGRRYHRSWTASSLGSTQWTPLADTDSNPFAGLANVTFPSGGTWTHDISHGEMIRAGKDQTLTISPCDLRYLYQGRDPAASGDYRLHPWRIGLIAQTNSTC